MPDHRFQEKLVNTRTPLVVAATAAALAVAGCASTGATTAGPGTAATPGPTATTAARGNAASPAAPVASGRPSTARPPAHTNAADLTIYPDHIGPLKIGMSLAAATATGLIVVNPGQGAPGPDSCTAAHWKGQSDHAWMVFNGEYGLRALDSFGDQQTPAGIRPGSTLAAVRRAYPHLTWRIDGYKTPDAKRTNGDVLVDVVKADGAHYRINIQKSKVTDVQLESDRTGCYE
jgi:hypothetical protein